MTKESNTRSQNHVPKKTNIQTSKKSVPVIRERKPENHKKHITRDGRKQNGRG
ncbi:hypothetical protein KKC36_00060 [Patescibacteria group bacterium]|nr:hypothetical protein [Patescibacteria group bacterium]